MLYSLLITLREGLEAALIIGILLAYLSKTRPGSSSRPIWAGALLALIVSLAGGYLLHALAGGLSGRALEIFEGGMIFIAVALLSQMILWMQRESRCLKANLQCAIEQRGNSPRALALLAFTVVVREGLETVLFLSGGAGTADSTLTYWGGALVGLAIASLLGLLLYRGALRLDLRRFFTVSGWLLILFAAGMIANGVKEWHEAKLLPQVIPHIWDTYALLPDTTVVGRLVGALLGYDPSPSLLQVLGWAGYLLVAGLAFYRGQAPRRNVPA
ncbi:MAG TPA: FTR1 family protein [Symbiobacteriaceae bacterium]|nr:FTR1 family protein [Symbiobacteriaceae bacterium]